MMAISHIISVTGEPAAGFLRMYAENAAYSPGWQVKDLG